MMTDKAAVELPSSAEGVVVETLAAEGEVVRVGAVLYVLETAAAGPASAPAHVKPTEAPAPAEAAPAPGAGAAGVLAPPAVRKLARELGVDLARVKGTGPGGRIGAEDVQRHAQAPAAAPASAPTMEGDRVPLRGVQRRMAETMSLSARTVAHVTGFHELDAGRFQELARRLRKEAETRGSRLPFDA